MQYNIKVILHTKKGKNNMKTDEKSTQKNIPPEGENLTNIEREIENATQSVFKLSDVHGITAKELETIANKWHNDFISASFGFSCLAFMRGYNYCKRRNKLNEC